MSELTLTAGAATAVVDLAAGARLATLRVAGHDLVGRGTDSPHGWGAFPMAPWAGRVRDGALTWRGTTHRLPTPKPPHAIHGLVSRSTWDVVDADESGARLRSGFGDGWPWAGHAELSYELAGDRLTTTLSVHADAEPMPGWCGVHPWFTRRLTGTDGAAVDVEIDLRARAMLARDDAGIATAQEVPVPAGAPVATPVDDCFVDVQWPVVLTWPGVARLEVTADAPYAVVFTEKDPAVCVEPQTGPPDATALDLAPVVEPGTPQVLVTTWTWALD